MTRITRRRLTATALALAAGAALPRCALAVTVGPRPQKVDDIDRREVPEVAVESWVEGLVAPWSLVFLPDGSALVSERPGRIRRIARGRLVDAPVARFGTVSGGEGGFMGLALHPDFPNPPFVYAMYTRRGPGGRDNRVIRLDFDGEKARLESVVIDGIPAAANHNGGRIAFGPDGMLYIGTGDVYQRELAQDPASLAGKILRLTPDGEIPGDNPDTGSPVYSRGHRNVQGLAWHPETGDMFATEHGPSGEVGFGAFDEVNRIVAGGNYGWPHAVGAPGVKPWRDPVAAWPEVSTPPSGMAFWRGGLFVATLRSEALLRLTLAKSGADWRATRIERWFTGRHGRLRDAVAGPDGALYVLTNNRDGRGDPRPGDDRILRIRAKQGE